MENSHQNIHYAPSNFYYVIEFIFLLHSQQPVKLYVKN